MSLTDSPYWTAACKNSVAKETWLIQLYYGDETNFLGISDRDLDITASGTSYHYHGVVKDFGLITESIDLIFCKANVGNIEIVCDNKLKNLTLAKEIFGTSTYYINRKVDIYSLVGDAADLSDCQQLYQGRLYSLSYNEDRIIIQIEQKTPADYIAIPNTKTYEGIYVPVIYGTYSFTPSTTSSRDFCHANIVHPVPKATIKNHEVHCLNHQADTADNPLFVYEKDFDIFVPLHPDNSNTKTHIDRSGNTFNTIIGPYGLRRAFLGRPISREGVTDFETDPENAIDTDNTTYSQQLDTITESDEGAYGYTVVDVDQEIDMPHISGQAVLYNFTLYAKREIYCAIQTYSNVSSAIISLNLDEYHYATENILGSQVSVSGGVGSDTDGPSTESSSLLARYEANDYQLPDVVTLRQRYSYSFVIEPGDGDFDASWRTRLYDVYFDLDVELDFANNHAASYAELERYDVFYAATDGYDADYTNGSGSVATEIHEIHRDIMDRFTGFDVADASMDGWSSLDTDRSGWNARVWLLEPVTVNRLLEQLQYEGCFIFRFSPNGGKYIHIENSYASADHTISDWDSINIRLTDFQDIITNTTYNYNRHPANNRYKSSDVFSNSTSRTNYWASIASEENKRQVNLDYLVNCGDNSESVYDTASSDGDNAPNESIAIYQDSLLSEPKIIINVILKDRKYWSLETGDIIQFENIDLFGYTASNVYFMAIEIQRSLTELNLLCREVYRT